MRQAMHAAGIGEMRNVYRILVQKPEGKNHLEDLNISKKKKKDLKETA
jgi:hypothetical protein